MISLSSFCWINRYTQSLLSAGRLLRCMKNQMERVISPSVRSSKHPSRCSSCSTFFTADLSSLCAVHSCQKLYLHILCHGWEAVLPVISLRQLTSLWDCLDQPDLFSFGLVLSHCPCWPLSREWPVYTQSPPVIGWFSWLLAKLTSRQTVLWAVHPPLCLSPSCLRCCIMPPLMCVFCLIFIVPWWTFLDLEFPPISVCSRHLSICHLICLPTQHAMIELLLSH